MLKPIIFWGGTGQAKVLRELVTHLGYQLVAVFDQATSTPPPFPDVPLFLGQEGFFRWREQWPAGPTYFLVAIGGARGRDRLERQAFLVHQDLTPATVVHPTAFVAANAVLGPGSQVLALAAVAVETRLGRACLINTRASVDHECQLGDGVHVGPGATLSGCVRIGAETLVGAGAVVLPRIRIGQRCVIGAGSVVTRDVPDDTVAYGNPARFRHPTSH